MSTEAAPKAAPRVNLRTPDVMAAVQAQVLGEDGGMRAIDDHEAAGDLGMLHGEGPRDCAAPVVADEDARAAERLDQMRDVVDEEREAVVVDVPRLRRVAVAAEVGRDRAQAGRGERGQLLPPRQARLGKAVKEDDERTVALRLVGQRHYLSRFTAA